MCGLIGYFQTKKDYFIKNKIIKFNNLLSNLDFRGPDHKNYYVDDDRSCYLGHTRLSILDLSKNSNQPIFSKNNNLIMVFNGEIYNHKELYKNISNLNLSKDIQKSDTRTLLEHISYHGFFETLKIVNGMFAIALYNLKVKKLYLARDRWGKKPLYYFYNNNKIFFSSTISPIIESKLIPNTINLNALSQYFQQGYITSDEGSIINGVKQVKPNSILEFEILNEKIVKFREKIIYENKKEKKSQFDIDVLENKIIKAVELRLNSDVDAGLLLSSGIDSSLVASISAKLNKNIDSFSVGFDHLYKDEDETQVAAEISKKLGIKNHKLALDKKDIHKFVSNIENAFDEPFADSSQIPSMIVFSKISKVAKVAITGDGGDEIFYGYNRYRYYNYWNKIFKFSKPFLKILNNRKLKKLFYRNMNYKLINQIEKFSNIFVSQNCIKYSDFTRLSLNESIVNSPIYSKNSFNENLECLEDLRNFDIQNYMVYDILTKVDRSSMYYGVEARSPLLDVDVFNYLKNSSIEQNITLFNNKILLRKILKKYLPNHLINKSKKGFSIPLDGILFSEIKNNYFDCYHYVKNNKLLNNLNKKNIEKYTYLFFTKKDLRFTSIVWSFYIYFKWLIKYENFLDFS